MDIDIKSYLQDKGLKVQTSPNGYQIQAFWRGGDGFNVSINKNNGLWYDFVTAEGGTFKELVKKICGESIEEINTISPIKFIEELSLPKIFDPSILKNIDKNHSYWAGRKIDISIFDKIDAGIIDLPKMENRHTTIIYNEKKQIIGLSGRSLNNSVIKWKILGRKKDFLFPYHVNKQEILDKKEVILLESPGDAFSLMTAGINNCLVMFGTNLSYKLLNTLISLNLQKIIISTNNDEINRFGNSPGKDAAKKIKNKLLNFFDENYIKIITPAPFNDLNEALQKKGVEFIKNLYS